MSGQVSYHAGLAAEAQVSRHLSAEGLTLLEERWRGPGGEIDLVLSDGDGFVFVEVKKAKDHATALARVTPRQLARIAASAEAYVADRSGGRPRDIRIDLALVDAAGRIKLVRNVTMH